MNPLTLTANQDPPTPNLKNEYATYCPIRPTKFRKHARLDLAKAAVTRQKSHCAEWQFTYFYGLVPPGVINKRIWKMGADDTISRMSMLIYEADGNTWKFLPRHSFAITPLIGYPVIIYPEMYHMPVRVKEALPNYKYLQKLAPRKKDPPDLYKWISGEQLWEYAHLDDF